MRRRGDIYECALCGAVLDVRDDARSQTMLIQASGEPTVRVVLVEGVEIHRCEVDRDKMAAGPG